MIFDDNDLEAMAKTLHGEARGEPRDGKVAVAWVIRNRAERNNMPFFAGALLGQAGAVHRVCHAPWQFSCWNADDPNRAVLEALTPTAYIAERTISGLVLDGIEADPTNGADHYHTIAKPGWAPSWPPHWAAEYAETARFGGHVFYDSRRRR